MGAGICQGSHPGWGSPPPLCSKFARSTIRNTTDSKLLEKVFDTSTEIGPIADGILLLPHLQFLNMILHMYLLQTAMLPQQPRHALMTNVNLESGGKRATVPGIGAVMKTIGDIGRSSASGMSTGSGKQHGKKNGEYGENKRQPDKRRPGRRSRGHGEGVNGGSNDMPLQ